MINDIVNALTFKIFETFEAVIYINEVPQKAKFPCFYIVLLDGEEKRLLDIRYQQEMNFLIQYITDINKPSKYNLYEVLEKMNDITDILTLENGDKLIGFNRKNEIVDNNLKMQVSYKYINYKSKEKHEAMGNLGLNGGIK